MAAAILATAPVWAADPPSQGDMNVDNLVDLGYQAATDAVSKGKGAGASASLVGILKNSDQVICQAWITSFGVRLRDIVV